MKTVINIVLVITLLGGVNVHAQTCNENMIPTTPVERFIDNGDGTVADKHTGLIWMRCSQGQTWDGTTCVGELIEYAWQEALQVADGYTYAGSSAWRLPNIKQLKSILEISCYSPAINLTIFPQTYGGNYWTASQHAYNSTNAWCLHFGLGGSGGSSTKSVSFPIRLVRQGATDEDGDGIADGIDNCPLDSNADQLNTDGDVQGNACDADDDNDGILDVDDDNPLVADTDAVTVTIDGIAQIENGTITPIEPRVVHQGKSLEFTVIADAGYYPHISGCGGSLVGTTFTIQTVNGDCSINLSFKLPTAPLNDTGINLCGNADNNGSVCPQVDFPVQDAEFGRDVVHNDNADGHAGFSFTKICNSGEAAGVGDCPAQPSLGSGVNQWACNRDNVTGLMWEVKTDDGGLRDKDNTYTWYNSDGNANGGDAGTEDGGTCPDVGSCDTEKYVDGVNVAGLCGYSDWRMPALSDLLSIVRLDVDQPTIDTAYFPNTINYRYWAASPSVFNNGAWVVHFSFGADHDHSKANGLYVRLVRSNSD